MKIFVIVLQVGIVNCSQIAFHFNKKMAFDITRPLLTKMLYFLLQRETFCFGHLNLAAVRMNFAAARNLLPCLLPCLILTYFSPI